MPCGAVAVCPGPWGRNPLPYGDPLLDRPSPLCAGRGADRDEDGAFPCPMPALGGGVHCGEGFLPAGGWWVPLLGGQPPTALAGLHGPGTVPWYGCAPAYVYVRVHTFCVCTAIRHPLLPVLGLMGHVQAYSCGPPQDECALCVENVAGGVRMCAVQQSPHPVLVAPTTHHPPPAVRPVRSCRSYLQHRPALCPRPSAPFGPGSAGDTALHATSASRCPHTG